MSDELGQGDDILGGFMPLSCFPRLGPTVVYHTKVVYHPTVFRSFCAARFPPLCLGLSPWLCVSILQTIGRSRGAPLQPLPRRQMDALKLRQWGLRNVVVVKHICLASRLRKAVFIKAVFIQAGQLYCSGDFCLCMSRLQVTAALLV